MCLRYTAASALTGPPVWLAGLACRTRTQGQPGITGTGPSVPTLLLTSAAL